jgi:hypothetical protein
MWNESFFILLYWKCIIIDTMLRYEQERFCWNPVGSSAAIAHRWQEPASCALLDAVLHTTVVLRCYLPVCGLPVSLHDSCHSPSTPHPRAVFTHRTATDWMFLVCRTILLLDTVVREEPRRPAVSEILEPALLVPMIITRSKSLRSLILPILTFNLTVTECLHVRLLALYTTWLTVCRSEPFSWTGWCT